MLLIIAEKGFINIVVELLKHSDKESLARKNKSGFDALHVTSKEGHGVCHCLHKLMSKKDGHLTLLVDIVKVLLDHDRSLGKTFGQSKCDSSDNCSD
nr:ankyrin repeat-containing protein ITN1-like [Aegilops tauschii subsp. strangulata]